MIFSSVDFQNNKKILLDLFLSKNDFVFGLFTINSHNQTQRDLGIFN